ncbi:protein SMG8-like [Ctenocephalides felis]|uniref:protein SMG8-like n=1 Tax=Ctenocephalides felis TaxID=7515 RepID=UPI000E6E4214|nr:protein SMG8-like [Ctenocephalides felis]
MRVHYARALLLLFQICHVLVLNLPGSSFDVSYMGLFAAIDNARQKFLSKTSTKLREAGVTSRWYQAGRLCSPRCLFLFEKSPLGRRPSSGSDVKKLEHALEDQIYRVLRKARVVTNRSADSLFSVPKNDEFVYVLTHEDGHGEDRLAKAIRDLVTSCQKFNANLKDDDPFGNFGKNPYIQGEEVCLTINPNRDEFHVRNFAEFLQKHIDTALGPGFEDNVGKYAASTPIIFEVPKLKTWCTAVSKLFTLYYGGSRMSSPDGTEKRLPESKNVAELLDILRDYLNPDIKFSEARCAKVLPVAKALYLEGLPSHYGRAQHTTRLNAALQTLHAHARGPCTSKYVKTLVKYALAHWRDGRRQCEAPSLTGQLCQRPRLAAKSLCEHNSGYVTLGVCDCGRTPGRREDPYSLRAANFDHYASLATDCPCCGSDKVKRITFPVFQPSTDDYRAAQLFTTHSTKPKGSKAQHNPSKQSSSGNSMSSSMKKLRNEVRGGGGTSSHPSEIGGVVRGDERSTPSARLLEDFDNGEEDDDVEDDEEEDVGDDDSKSVSSDDGSADKKTDVHSGGVNEIIIQVSENGDGDQTKEKGLVRQPSTTEYLPGMLHMQSPPGLLPQFPSWSLVCLGASSLYSHNLGLSEAQHPGFIQGTNFLLPWDVTVRLETAAANSAMANWPYSNDRRKGAGRHGGKHHGSKYYGSQSGSNVHKGNEFIVKIFVGMEYECPRGHRFMMSTSEKILRATTGLVKESGSRVAGSDMPLFHECPCSSPKQMFVAQLMRVHVVTPKAPVHVTLDPKVQTASNCSSIPGPIFITGVPDGGARLSQSAYWVLRLPYVYHADGGRSSPSHEAAFYSTGVMARTPPGGRLLAGMFGIAEMEKGTAAE